MNIRFMCEALNYFNQRARFERYLVIINSHKMTIRDNVIYGEFGRTSFVGAKEFLIVMFYEGILVNCDRDKILLYYNALINKNCPKTKV